MRDFFSRDLIAQGKIGKEGKEEEKKIVGAPYAMECLCMERCSASCKRQVL